MISHRLLFLLGGSAAFDVTAEEFVPVAGGCAATIALLLQGGAGWEKYLPEYTQPWTSRGVTRYCPIVPGEDGTLDLGAALARLREATGIFIGGGHTPTYHRLYATEPIHTLIRSSYQRGIPVAGVSAGALIAPEVCAIPPEDTGDDSTRILSGLGLISDVIIGVHFTELDALPGVLEAMAKTRTPTGWGIDEAACALFEDGRFKSALGRSIHHIVMTNFEARAHFLVQHGQSCH